MRTAKRRHDGEQTAAVRIQSLVRRWRAGRAVRAMRGAARDERVRQAARDFDAKPKARGTLSAKENCAVM